MWNCTTLTAITLTTSPAITPFYIGHVINKAEVHKQCRSAVSSTVGKKPTKYVAEGAV